MLAREMTFQAALPNDGFEPRALASPVRILVVDDHDGVRTVTSAMLREFGFEVVAVANATEALLAVCVDLFDLVLMDINLPDSNGMDVTGMLKAQSGCADLPVIAFTGGDRDGMRRQALAAGMQDLLAKPFQPADLRRMVERWARLPATPAGVGRPDRGMSRAEAEALLRPFAERAGSLLRRWREGV